MGSGKSFEKRCIRDAYCSQTVIAEDVANHFGILVRNGTATITATYKSKSITVDAKVSADIENEIVVSWRDAHRLGTVVINGLDLEPETRKPEPAPVTVTAKPAPVTVTAKPAPVTETLTAKPVPEPVTATPVPEPEPVPETKPEPKPEPEPPAPLQKSASAVCKKLTAMTEPVIMAQIPPADTHQTLAGASPNHRRNPSGFPANPQPTLRELSPNPHLTVNTPSPLPCLEPHQTLQPPEPDRQTSLGQIIHDELDERVHWVKSEYRDFDSESDEDADSAPFIPPNSCSDGSTNVGEEQGVTESDSGDETDDYESAAEEPAPSHERGDVPDESESDNESGYETADEDPVPAPRPEHTHDGSGDPGEHSHQEKTEDTWSFVYWLLSQVKVLGATEFLRYRTLFKRLCHQLSTGTKTSTMGQTPPSRPIALVQPAAPTSIREHSGTSLIEVNMDSNGDGSGLTYWTIALIMAATLFLVYVIKRFRACRKRANERHAAEAARDARFHALALMPRNQVDRLGDRLEELDININERQAPPREAPDIEANPPPRRQRR